MKKIEQKKNRVKIKKNGTKREQIRVKNRFKNLKKNPEKISMTTQ